MRTIKMKKIIEIISLLAFLVSFFCMLCFNGETIWQQVAWTAFWMIGCAISGRIFYKLHGEPYKDMEA